MADIVPRWLSPEQTAAYIGERVDRLPRLRRAGKLPEPSYHLGPRSPRYDREALDRLFLGRAAGASVDQITQDAVDAILRRARARRLPRPGDNNGPGVRLRRPGAPGAE